MCPLKEKPDLPDPTDPLGKNVHSKAIRSCSKHEGYQSPRESTGKEKPPKMWIIFIPDMHQPRSTNLEHEQLNMALQQRYTTMRKVPRFSTEGKQHV